MQEWAAVRLMHAMTAGSVGLDPDLWFKAIDGTELGNSEGFDTIGFGEPKGPYDLRRIALDGKVTFQGFTVVVRSVWDHSQRVYDMVTFFATKIAQSPATRNDCIVRPHELFRKNRSL